MANLKGLDISHHNSVDLNKVSYDFMIHKATGGTGYVDPNCDKNVQKAIKAGKKWGVYHYYADGYSGDDPIKEAEFFVKNIKGYIGKGILVLDWESGGNKHVNSPDYALKWLQHVEKLTGVKPAIYMNRSTENNLDWSKVVKNNNGLWLADWSSTTNPTLKHWSFFFIRQYTSKGTLAGYTGLLDLDTGYLTRSAWDKYAAAKTTAPVITTKDVTTTQVVPFEKKIVKDTAKDIGYSKITTAGVNGIRTIVTTITYTDGKQTSTKVKSDTITKQPVTEVTTVGTKQPEPVPTPDPNFFEKFIVWLLEKIKTIWSK